jgi:hypothetical protein
MTHSEFNTLQRVSPGSTRLVMNENSELCATTVPGNNEAMDAPGPCADLSRPAGPNLGQGKNGSRRMW